METDEAKTEKTKDGFSKKGCFGCLGALVGLIILIWILGSTVDIPEVQRHPSPPPPPKVPLEPDAIIGSDVGENRINTLIKMVRESGHRCDTVSSARELVFSTGYQLVCNQYRYEYLIQDKGGRWVVTVE